MIVGLKMANSWTDPPCVIMISLIGGLPAWIISQVMIAKYFGIVYVPLLTLAIYLYYDYVHLNTPAAETTNFITFKVCAHPCAPLPPLSLDSAAPRPGVSPANGLSPPVSAEQQAAGPVG